jgi:tetratricopeptide (TPR) repeat protein
MTLLAIMACGGRSKPAAPQTEWDSEWATYRDTFKPDPNAAKPPQAATTLSGPALVCPSTATFVGVDQLVSDSKQAMYDQKFDIALTLTGSALRVQPNDAEAWAIRGSAFYMLQKLDEAKAAWSRAYSLDPCRKEIPGFLDQIKAQSK